MPKEFKESLDPKQGKHYWIVEHVPVIYLCCKVHTGYYSYDILILHSKHLVGSKWKTINKNDGNNINA